MYWEVFTEELCGQKKWGKGPVKRVIGAGAGLIFKGSGFYITDYRSEKYKEAAKKDSGASNAPSSSSDSKVESKAESKSGGESKPSAPAAVKSETKPAKSKSNEK